MSQSTKDHMGRPIVVVTGIGIVTSLGQGKEDNWRDLTAGVSGIRPITRFDTDGLRTRIAGTNAGLGLLLLDQIDRDAHRRVFFLF